MKRFQAILLFLFLIAGTSTITAQELKEGSVTIGITELESSDQQAAAMMPMFKSSTMKFDFNELKSLMTMNMMNGMMKMRVLVDNKTSATTMLMDMMGQKTMTNVSAEDAKKTREENKIQDEEIPFDFEVVYDKGDTKEILGRKCVKANIKIKPKDEKEAKDMENVDLKIFAYVTNEIKFPKAMIETFEKTMGEGSFKLKDFPLEFSMSFNDGQNNGKITLAATEILTSLAKGTFELDTTGYEEKDMKEMFEGNGMGGF